MTSRRVTADGSTDRVPRGIEGKLVVFPAPDAASIDRPTHLLVTQREHRSRVRLGRKDDWIERHADHIEYAANFSFRVVDEFLVHHADGAQVELFDRGRGTYTALMAARLAEARAMGKDAAVLQGDRKTSAPICVKLGFREVCSVDFYAWSPTPGAKLGLMH